MKYIPWAILVIGVCSFLTALSVADWSVANLFFTPDQRGEREMDRKAYAKAAEAFEDPMWRGAALYRAGAFKEAAAAFGQDDSAQALYNRSNALIMLGSYDQAIAGYQKALAVKPGWRDAADNLELAMEREKRLHAPNAGDQGTDGFLPPDKIVFDKQAANAPDDQKQTVSGGQRQLTDEELRDMWLRRVQTRPADFLRAKFSYQSAQQDAGDKDRKAVP